MRELIQSIVCVHRENITFEIRAVPNKLNEAEIESKKNGFCALKTVDFVSFFFLHRQMLSVMNCLGSGLPIDASAKHRIQFCVSNCNVSSVF